MKSCFLCERKIKQGMYCKACLKKKKEVTHAYFKTISKEEYNKNERR